MTELVYRLTALALAVTYMTTRSVFERRLKRPSKRDEFKRADARDRRELLVIAVATLPQWLYMLSPWLDFASMGLPDAVRWFGAALTTSGIGAFVWTHSALAGNWTPFVERPPTGSLVTSGPYRWVRHPMYTTFFIYNGGLWLLTSNWLAGAPAFLAFAWMYLDRVGREERLMLEQFGDEYRTYAENTGRVLPGVGKGRLG